MDFRAWSLLVWIAVLLAFIPYVRRIRHADMPMVAAWTIFAVAFSVAGLVLYGLVSWIAVALGAAAWLATPVGVVVFLVLVFVPAFLTGRWQARRPPRRAPPLDGEHDRDRSLPDDGREGDRDDRLREER